VPKYWQISDPAIANPPLCRLPLRPDNVWDIDCSGFSPTTVNGMDIHGAYFMTDATIDLMRQVLKGLDRDVLVDRKIAPPPKL
jgi:hypothetical protein